MSHTLFCIPYAGCSASMFNIFNGKIPGVQIVPLDYAGKGVRIGEPMHSRIAGAVEDCAASVIHHGNFSNYSLFGYSMGGVIAYETALLLNKTNVNLPHNIILAACEPPDSIMDGHTSYMAMSDAEFIEYLISTGGIDSELTALPEFLDLFLPIIRNDHVLLEFYEPTKCETPLSVAFHVAYSDDERNASGWRRYTSVKCDLTHFDGGHFFIRDNPGGVCKYIEDVLNGRV